MCCIGIAMAVYNGEKYIAGQIESILDQSYKEWKLIIRDDGSYDSTPDIIKKYAGLYPDKICLIDNGNKGLGAAQNFASLLGYMTSDYIMFCDQDDVWLPEKIELTFKRMKQIEVSYGKEKPVLVHTDLKVADSDLGIISDSFWKHQYIDPDAKSLNRLLIQNNITGCTIMINKALKDLIEPIPKEAVMHDWWIALVASAFGVIDYINEPTMLYRQHGANGIGAKGWNRKFIIRRILGLGKVRDSLLDTQKQARVLFERYSGRMDKRNSELTNIYSDLNRYNLFKRRGFLFKYRVMKNGFIRNVGLFLLI